MMKITPLTRENLDGVCQVENLCSSHPWSRESLQKDIANEHAVYFCMEDDGVVIGYISMWSLRGEGNINNLAVLPQYRRQGHGRALLTCMIDHAVTHRFSFLTLEVRSSNLGAIRLYESCGFRQVGLRKKYYDHSEDAILMTLTFS